MKQVYVTNREIIDVFRHHIDTESLTAASFTVYLFYNGTISSLTPVVQEIGDGFYRVSFTPNAEGLWNLDLFETADATVHYQGTYNVLNLERRDQIAEEIRRLDLSIRRQR